MSATISEEYVFSLLRKLPSNSFNVKWRRVQPNVPLPSTGLDLVGGTAPGKKDVTLQLNGAVNEMALLSHARVVVGLSSTEAINHAAAITFNQADLSPINKKHPYTHLNFKYGGANVIVKSTESFNAGSLCLYDNNNADSFAPVNVARGLCARRSAKYDWDHPITNVDDIVLNSLQINDLESAGFSSTEKRARGCGYVVTGTGAFAVNEFTKAAANGYGAPVTLFTGAGNLPRDSVQTLKFPLSMFSSLASTMSVHPIGLFSSFSVNGYQVSLQFDGSGSIVAPDLGGTTQTAATSATTAGAQTVKLHSVEIHYPVVTILQPEVMQGILSLYRKEASIQVGDVSVPASLRMNTINYHISTFGLQSGKNFFHIPSTAKSSRGLLWMIYDQAGRSRNRIPDNATVDRTAEANSALTYPLCTKGITVREVELKIGSENVSGCVRNDNPDSGVVESYIYENIKKGAGVFSPFPYYEELMHHEVAGVEDLVHDLRNKSERGPIPTGTNITNSAGYRTRNNYSIQYGIFDLQNMDYRSKQDSGVIASGKSLNNIGRYDVSMDFAGIVQQDSGANTYGPVATPTDYRIVFIEAVDTVIEASAQSGVQDISNVVMV